mmetsp:Transcript_22419/g.42300  ORF Transcript_22419/g.42300 Transcript_22419/m.42300 type:complete len:302 (+) Transcript_22419:60-965(+)
MSDSVLEALECQALYLRCRDLAQLDAAGSVWHQKITQSCSWAICLARELQAVCLSQACIRALTRDSDPQLKTALQQLLAAELGLLVPSCWSEELRTFSPFQQESMELSSVAEAKTFACKTMQAHTRILRSLQTGAEFYGMNLVRIAWPEQDCISHPIIFENFARSRGRSSRLRLQFQWCCDHVQFRAVPQEPSLILVHPEVLHGMVVLPLPDPQVLVLDIWTVAQKPLICIRNAVVKVDGRWWDAHGLCAARMDDKHLSQALEEGVWCMLSMTDVTDLPTPIEPRAANGYSFLNGLGLEAL